MKTTNVGLAEYKISSKPDEALVILGLGSSIGLFFFDPRTQVAAAAHVMLPAGRDEDAHPTKYCSSAVPFLLAQMQAAGASTEELKVAVFGGATMLSTGPTSLLEIGQRNTAAAADALVKAGLTPVVSDTGGSKGRNVALEVATGYVTVKVLAQPDRVYADLTLGPEVGQ